MMKLADHDAVLVGFGGGGGRRCATSKGGFRFFSLAAAVALFLSSPLGVGASVGAVLIRQTQVEEGVVGALGDEGEKVQNGNNMQRLKTSLDLKQRVAARELEERHVRGRVSTSPREEETKHHQHHHHQGRGVVEDPPVVSNHDGADEESESGKTILSAPLCGDFLPLEEEEAGRNLVGKKSVKGGTTKSKASKTGKKSISNPEPEPEPEPEDTCRDEDASRFGIAPTGRDEEVLAQFWRYSWPSCDTMVPTASQSDIEEFGVCATTYFCTYTSKEDCRTTDNDPLVFFASPDVSSCADLGFPQLRRVSSMNPRSGAAPYVQACFLESTSVVEDSDYCELALGNMTLDPSYLTCTAYSEARIGGSCSDVGFPDHMVAHPALWAEDTGTLDICLNILADDASNDTATTLPAFVGIRDERMREALEPGSRRLDAATGTYIYDAIPGDVFKRSCTGVKESEGGNEVVETVTSIARAGILGIFSEVLGAGVEAVLEDFAPLGGFIGAIFNLLTADKDEDPFEKLRDYVQEQIEIQANSEAKVRINEEWGKLEIVSKELKKKLNKTAGVFTDDEVARAVSDMYKRCQFFAGTLANQAIFARADEYAPYVGVAGPLCVRFNYDRANNCSGVYQNPGVYCTTSRVGLRKEENDLENRKWIQIAKNAEEALKKWRGEDGVTHYEYYTDRLFGIAGYDCYGGITDKRCYSVGGPSATVSSFGSPNQVAYGWRGSFPAPGFESINTYSSYLLQQGAGAYRDFVVRAYLDNFGTQALGYPELWKYMNSDSVATPPTLSRGIAFSYLRRTRWINIDEQFKHNKAQIDLIRSDPVKHSEVEKIVVVWDKGDGSNIKFYNSTFNKNFCFQTGALFRLEVHLKSGTHSSVGPSPFSVEGQTRDFFLTTDSNYWPPGHQSHWVERIGAFGKFDCQKRYKNFAFKTFWVDPNTEEKVADGMVRTFGSQTDSTQKFDGQWEYAPPVAGRNSDPSRGNKPGVSKILPNVVGIYGFAGKWDPYSYAPIWSYMKAS